MFDSCIRKIPWRRAWQPTAVFLPGESHGQRSLEGYSPWGRRESDLTEATCCTRMHAHTHTHTHTQNYFVLISRNWKIFFTGFILSDDQLVYLRGKFAISKDAEFNPEVFLTALLGGVISTIGSTLFHIQLNRQNSGLSELGIKSK